MLHNILYIYILHIYYSQYGKNEYNISGPMMAMRARPASPPSPIHANDTEDDQHTICVRAGTKLHVDMSSVRFGGAWCLPCASTIISIYTLHQFMRAHSENEQRKIQNQTMG